MGHSMKNMESQLIENAVKRINDEFGVDLKVFSHGHPVQIAGVVGDGYLYYYAKHGLWQIAIADNHWQSIDGIVGSVKPDELAYYAEGDYSDLYPSEQEIYTVICKALEDKNG